MKIEDWPIYVSDDGHITCYAANFLGDVASGVVVGSCEAWDWSQIGRRADVGKFLAALREHAREAHGVEFEDNEVVAIRISRENNGGERDMELVYDRRKVTEFNTEFGMRQTSCNEEGHSSCGYAHRRPTHESTLKIRFDGLDSRPKWREVSDGS